MNYLCVANTSCEEGDHIADAELVNSQLEECQNMVNVCVFKRHVIIVPKLIQKNVPIEKGLI